MGKRPLTLKQAVPQAWERIRNRVEVTQDLNFDHEFTLQFHLAWEIATLLRFPRNLEVEFEVPCGRDSNGERIRLDLLMWTDPKAKIAIELKAPVRSETGMNSNMTQTRMRFYRDIDRLRHLTESRSDIALGYFVAVVNERGYVVEGGQYVNRAYKTYHETVIPACKVVRPELGPNGCKYRLRMPPHEIRWSWRCAGV